MYANLGPHQYFVSMIGLLTCTRPMEYFARMPVDVFRINTQNTTDPAAVFNCSALELFSLPETRTFLWDVLQSFFDWFTITHLFRYNVDRHSDSKVCYHLTQLKNHCRSVFFYSAIRMIRSSYCVVHCFRFLFLFDDKATLSIIS